jgi:hypothetical protein
MMTRPDNFFDWEELLLFIEERRVIPIIGKELLVVDIDGTEVVWEHLLAQQLAGTLGIDAGDLPPNCDLNDVALVYVRQGGKRTRIYSRIKSLVEEHPVPIPESLKKIAAITHFNLYISTFSSPHLVKAIDEVRFKAEKKTRCLSYSPYLPTEDLPNDGSPSSLATLRVPYVYQLFGPLTSATDFAVTEEDTLEFLHSLQSDSHRPKNLFNELKRNHLLFLGCSFPDWLERFFVRTIVNERLLLPRETSQLIADTCTHADHRLALFLRHYQTDVYDSGSSTGFVDELYARWRERNRSSVPQAVPASSGARKMEAGAIFLSYARQDQAAVQALRTALENAGLDVWFDLRELQPGESWEREIKANVLRCSMFVPVLSRNTQNRYEGYFRREWKLAIKRAELMDDRFPFIQPVIVDDLPEGVPEVPEEFWERHCTRCPGGQPTPDFLEHTRETIRGLRLAEAGRQ